MSGSRAAGLGFSGGMALGLKLAQPDRRIVQVIGDGGFHFSSPDSVYAVAQQYQASDLHGRAGQWRLAGGEMPLTQRCIPRASPPRPTSSCRA